MAANQLPEVWLRGPIPGISPYLQPVAHALLQAKEEVNEITKAFPKELLWIKPASMASAGFHLQHLTGVLDRLFTYAQGKSLSDEQLQTLRAEGNPAATTADVYQLTAAFNKQIDTAIDTLKHIDEATLLEPRGVGRAKLPSTVFGLLFHSAEHTMRHVGQLLVTTRVLLSDHK